MTDKKTELEEHAEELINYLELYYTKVKTARDRGHQGYTDVAVQRWYNRLKAAKIMYGRL